LAPIKSKGVHENKIRKWENSNVVSTLNIQHSQFKGDAILKGEGLFETLGLGPFKVENAGFICCW
jgi:hypothetical protein